MSEMLKDLQVRFKRKLADNELSLLKVLNELALLKLSDEIDLIDFECFVDGYRVGYYPMTLDATQLGYKSVIGDIIDSEEFDPYPEEYDFDDEEFEEQVDDFHGEIAADFQEWFRECWLKSKFINVERPCYFCFHDDDLSIDLRTGKEVSSNKKWSHA